MSFLFKSTIKLCFFFVGLFISLIRTIVTHALSFGSLFILLFVFLYGFNYFVYSPVSFFRRDSRPSFDIQSTNGGRVTSKGLGGQCYILYFTSVYCKKCTKQIKKLEELRELHEAAIYPVFSDSEDDVIKDLYQYQSWMTTALLDTDNTLHRKFFAYILPQLSVVNAQGKIVLDITGTINDRDLRRIKKALKNEIYDKKTNELIDLHAMQSIET